ncbi:hypothetical protein [Chitinibacter tainanensis]|uniref:hypothetical protein n=1 Tax=Chitinibacter tainanensis TaxID=230667 RepID=UPI0003FF0F05|nr:hypothetical protein [Chitinibacter tainanensis]
MSTAPQARQFTNPILVAAAQKVETEQLQMLALDLAFRIEMALNCGLAQQIDQFRENSEGMPFFLRHLLRDLRALDQKDSTLSAPLKRRLRVALQPHDQTGSFKRTLLANEPGQLSSLAVR